LIPARLVAAAFALLAAGAAPRPASSQPAASASLRLAPARSAARERVLPSPTPFGQSAENAGRPSLASHAWRATIGIGGGAVVGGWLGYFASQVSRSDWDQRPDSERDQMRRRYTLSGSAVGALVGYFMRPRAASAARGPQGVPPRAGRQLLGAAELRRTLATNLLEAVELERPEWIEALRKERGTSAVSAPANVPGETVVVYLGEERVGALESLLEISLPEIHELRFYDAADATRRWQVRHRYGAIEVLTAGTAPAPPAGGSTGNPP
jgi:hypothetical protein